MELKNMALGIFGVLGLLFWAAEYLRLFKRPELFFPIKYVPKNFPKNTLRRALFFLGLLGWGLVTFALMGPKKNIGHQKNQVEVNDIFLVVDVSRSMLAEDFVPNRLEVAKKRIAEFVELLPTDRIGIIMFSEQIFTLLPLTLDLELVKASVAEIKIGPLGAGTNIGDSVGLAVARLGQTPTKKKIIILLTDGVSQVDSITPLEAAVIAKDKGIKIYTIAVGSDDDAKIPIYDSVFGKRYQAIPGGSVDVVTLQKMAAITKGRFFSAKNEQSLKEVLAEIQRLEKTKITLSGQLVYEEKFYIYLFWGIFLLLLVELLRRCVLKEVI